VGNRTELIVESALPSVASTETQVGKIPCQVGKIPSEGTKEDESKIKSHPYFGHIGKERPLQLVEHLDDIMIKQLSM